MRDKTGYETLLSVAKADKLNQWMYETIRPFTRGNILELGSGLGNISKFFIDDDASITLSDIDDDYLAHLKKEFSSDSNVKGFLSINLQKKDFNFYYAQLKEKFDTVFLLNVMEHLEDDDAAIQNINFLLKSDGILIILVPAYKFLYSELDIQLGHFRRYTKKMLAEKVAKGSFRVEKSFYFNMMGIPAWYYGKIKKLKVLSSGKMKLYNRLIGIGRLLDKIAFKSIGLSVIAVARKK